MAVIALCAAGIGASFAMFWSPPQPAQWLEISQGRAQLQRHRLDQDAELRIEGRRGVSHIRIEQGRARFLQSPCRNQVCVRNGWLQHRGDAAACLPNGISLRLSGQAQGNLDALAH